MTHLSELMNPSDLYEDVQQGYVRIQTHPTLPLRIMNYAEKAVFDRVWNPVTRQCRGLIVNDKDEVLARPFAKFFNYSEPLAPVIELDEPVQVLDKVDGSLGILYPTGDGGHAIATRGSFTSDQAQHATALYQDRYAGRWSPAAGFTYLFEIVYPENRIVVRYDMDDLVLLGAVRISTGIAYLGAAESEWPGPTVKRFEYETLAEALAAPPRDGQEGLVVTTPTDPERRIKIKYEEYVRLHKIVTGLNARAVWEALGAGQRVPDICAELPDEFHQWTQDVACQLMGDAHRIVKAAEKEHARILDLLPKVHTRKDYALIAKEHDLRAYLFKLADGREITEQAWKAVYPEGNVTPSGRTFTEATA